MDQKKKLLLTSAAAALCIIVLAIMSFKVLSPDSRFEGLEGEKMWVKCLNPSCAAAYEMDKIAFFQQLEKRGPMAETIACKKCSQLTAARAIKCPKCTNIFVERAAGRDELPDRCPKCRYSELADSVN